MDKQVKEMPTQQGKDSMAALDEFSAETVRQGVSFGSSQYTESPAPTTFTADTIRNGVTFRQ